MAKRKSKRRGRRGRPSALSSIGTMELQAELQRRQSRIGEMQKRHSALRAELDELEAELGAMGGYSVSAGGRGKGRGGRRGGARRGRPSAEGGRKTLPDFLVEVLTGKTLGVSEAVDAVKRAGYASNSPNLRTMVNQALLANKSRFKKVARGQYTAK